MLTKKNILLLSFVAAPLLYGMDNSTKRTLSKAEITERITQLTASVVGKPCQDCPKTVIGIGYDERRGFFYNIHDDEEDEALVERMKHGLNLKK